MLSLQLVCTLLLFFSQWAVSLSLTGNRTLVIFDNNTIEDINKFEKFTTLLTDHSLDLTFIEVNEIINSASTSSPTTNELDLFHMENRKFDNLIILPIKNKKLNNKFINSKKLLKFFDNNGNIIILSNPNNLLDSKRNLLNQLGIFPSPRDQIVIDNFNNNKKNNDLIVSTENCANDYVFNNTQDDIDSFNFGKSSIALLNNNELIVPIMRASRTSFVNPININNNNNKQIKDAWFKGGSQGYLIAGFQGLNNARITWLGSTDFISNENFSQNESFINELIRWALLEKSVIKSINPRHSHALTNISYDELKYKATDSINYQIGFSEWNGQKWIPFIANDIQFELRQVDPYYRITMKPMDNDSGEIQYYTTDDFKLPNRQGMFKFLTHYKRNGLTFIEESDVKSIRHLANDEYPRSYQITNAWVYMTSIVVVIIAFVIFVISFLTDLPKDKNVSLNKKNK